MESDRINMFWRGLNQLQWKCWHSTIWSGWCLCCYLRVCRVDKRRCKTGQLRRESREPLFSVSFRCSFQGWLRQSRRWDCSQSLLPKFNWESFIFEKKKTIKFQNSILSTLFPSPHCHFTCRPHLAQHPSLDQWSAVKGASSVKPLASQAGALRITWTRPLPTLIHNWGSLRF